MYKSFINFRYIGKYTNWPVVSFFSVGLSFLYLGMTSVLKHSGKIPMTVQLL